MIFYNLTILANLIISKLKLFYKLKAKLVNSPLYKHHSLTNTIQTNEKMEYFHLTLLFLFILLITFSLSLLFYKHMSQYKNHNLPPGKPGLPFVGESLEFLSTGRKGHPEKFVFDRTTKYSSNVFKTNLFGHPMSAVELKATSLYSPRKTSLLYPGGLILSTKYSLLVSSHPPLKKPRK